MTLQDQACQPLSIILNTTRWHHCHVLISEYLTSAKVPGFLFTESTKPECLPHNINKKKNHELNIRLRHKLPTVYRSELIPLARETCFCRTYPASNHRDAPQDCDLSARSFSSARVVGNRTTGAAGPRRTHSKRDKDAGGGQWQTWAIDAPGHPPSPWPLWTPSIPQYN